LSRTFLCPAMKAVDTGKKASRPKWKRCLAKLEFKEITDEHQAVEIEWWKNEEHRGIASPPKDTHTAMRKCPGCGNHITIHYEPGKEIGYRPLLKEEKKSSEKFSDATSSSRSPIESIISDPAYSISRRVGNTIDKPYRQTLYETLLKIFISTSLSLFLTAAIGIVAFQYLLWRIEGITPLGEYWVWYWIAYGIAFAVMSPVILGLYRETKLALGRALPLIDGEGRRLALTKSIELLGMKWMWLLGYAGVLIMRVSVLSLPGGIGTQHNWLAHTMIYFIAVIPELLFVYGALSILFLIYILYRVTDRPKTDLSSFLKSVSVYETLADVAIRLTLTIAVSVAVLRVAYLYGAQVPDLYILSISSTAGSAIMLVYMTVAIFPLAFAAYYLSRGIERHKKEMIYSLESMENQADVEKIIGIVRSTPNRLYYFDIIMRAIVALLVFIFGGSVIADIFRI